MSRCLRSVALTLGVLALFTFSLLGQEDSGWRISPKDINIQMGDDRALQLLDDSAQELHGAIWSVDDPDKASIQEEDGLLVLHAKAVGTVRVTAALNGEMRFRDIKIWSAVRPIPPGNTNWGMEPIGREIGDLPAVPTADGPATYSLEQTASGRTYLRAVRDDGIQVWTWLMPEHTRNVELVCGDWLGGALISANRSNSYTLYTVGKDGELRWRYTLAGVRKGHAYNPQHLVHILSQSSAGMVTTVTGLDEVTGDRKFELTLPGSHEKQINVQKAGTSFSCVSRSSSNPVHTSTSRLFVNIDGLAYIAFTQYDWTLETAKCKVGSQVSPRDVNLTRDERVVLWQIHPDGTYRRTIVEETKNNGPYSDSANVAAPTGSIIPDGFGGVLVSMRLSHDGLASDASAPTDELVYRIDDNGDLVYRYALPRYVGPLRDEMVLGEDGVGFATRGSLLLAFDVRTGREMWRWDSNTPDIEVFAALANGGCLVQTPTALVEVDNANESKEVLQGKAMMGWNGQLYRKHQ
jgi:outer membrane protein assembly factor BamB